MRSPPHKSIIVEGLEFFNMLHNCFSTVINTTLFDKCVHSLNFREIYEKDTKKTSIFYIVIKFILNQVPELKAFPAIREILAGVPW